MARIDSLDALVQPVLIFRLRIIGADPELGLDVCAEGGGGGGEGVVHVVSVDERDGLAHGGGPVTTRARNVLRDTNVRSDGGSPIDEEQPLTGEGSSKHELKRSLWETILPAWRRRDGRCSKGLAPVPGEGM